MNVIFENFIHSLYTKGVSKKNKDSVLEKRIKALPDDVKQFIYWEYLDTEVHSRIFKRLLETQSTRSLHINDIRPYLATVLAKPKVIDFLRKSIDSGYEKPFLSFDIVYKQYKMNERDSKIWKGASNGDAFCYSLVMYMYH
jgi:hypothetical protein